MNKKGLKARGRSITAEGDEWVLDVVALSDGSTLYLFYVRSLAEFYEENALHLQQVLSTVRLTACM